jgi:L-2-hydroxyglutarate oxidase LhgO
LSEFVDTVVIGAGVAGLAIARSLAMSKRDVLILESQLAFGTGVSSRSSEVVHAGMYYPKNSLKAKLCVAGGAMLRNFARDHNVDCAMVGKLIVATSKAEMPALDAILARGHANGVASLVAISGEQAMQMEPELWCHQALWSPQTSIIDSHGLMLALVGEIEAHGGQLVVNAPVTGGRVHDRGIEIFVGGVDPMTIVAQRVVLAAGISSPRLARSFGLKQVPQDYLCKGSYFTLTGKMPFAHLVYPVPLADGLGVHYTMDLQNRGRFGPDVQWVDVEDYAVNADRAPLFCQSVKRYWPGIEGRDIIPAYAGIRPKVYGPHEAAADFIIQGPEQHGLLGLVALYGIESPGLTSSLALAQLVTEMLE